ncbi:agmatinase [Arsenicitalea aurantiaca]|uniref:Agmatinase n=1 Tax=Arsenicitalea aurantiaca TaxID=1783274 RepID=A0A433XAL9_9HYPH|nr:arginase family protein [Arsenicitalea aurantiaca]RUT31137.1 agmatinase [Arsenicitalea aurantiaca]
MAQKVTILGVPFDSDAGSILPTGLAQAPEAIRRALFAPGAETSELGVAVIGHPELSDMGDLKLEGWPAAEAGVVIRASAEGLVEKGHRVMGLGGDQSVSYSLIAGQASAGAIDVLHIDARPDIEASSDGVSPAVSVFSRLIEEGLVRHMVQVGLRAPSAEQSQRMQELGIVGMRMKDWRGVPEIDFGGRFYLSIDLSGIDPACCPGVVRPEPGGLGVRDVMSLIHRVRGEMVGADIVECATARDLGGLTALTAARLARECVARLLEDVVEG